MRKVTGLSVLLAVFTSGSAFAQGIYLDKGTSGFGAAVGASTNDDANVLSLLAGYSFEGFIDAGAFLHRYGFDENPAFDASAIGINPYVNVHALRHDETIPVSVAATANFQKLFYSVEPDTVDISAWSVFFGGSVYRRLALGDRFEVTPQATLGFNHTKVTVEVPPFGKSSDGDGTIVFQVAGNFAMRDGGRIWVLNPVLTFDEDNATFGLFIGGVF